jgi:hypothetical protein
VASDDKVQSRVGGPLLIVLLVAVAGLGAWWYFAGQPREAPPPPGITAEAKAYVRNLQLSEVDMKATANYAGGMVVEILGKIKNAGDRPLERVELNCVFYDPYGQVVLRERVPIVRTSLKPGETKTFRLPFEGLPGSWNQSMPQMVIAHIAFSA